MLFVTLDEPNFIYSNRVIKILIFENKNILKVSGTFFGPINTIAN